MVCQRYDVDHYIVTSESTETRYLVLGGQGDRAYPAPLAVQTLPVEANPNAAITALAAESNLNQQIRERLPSALVEESRLSARTGGWKTRAKHDAAYTSPRPAIIRFHQRRQKRASPAESLHYQRSKGRLPNTSADQPHTLDPDHDRRT